MLLNIEIFRFYKYINFRNISGKLLISADKILLLMTMEYRSKILGVHLLT